MGYTQKQLVKLMKLRRDWDEEGGLPVAPSVAKLVLMLVDAFIFEDNLATPQLSPQRTGGVDVEWLIGGNHMSLSVSADGDIVAWALSPQGHELFSFDSDVDMFDAKGVARLINEARRFLEEFSPKVQKRILI
ncbi:hypothetical protein R4P47_13455 [Rhodococcus sp. IEGM 1370]|nr:hypothetical protein [Rhodococcus sp. IEGM 1370]